MTYRADLTCKGREPVVLRAEGRTACVQAVKEYLDCHNINLWVGVKLTLRPDGEGGVNDYRSYEEDVLL